MTPIIAMALVTLGLLFLNVQHKKTTTPPKEATFENHKKRYIEEEKKEATQTLNQTVTARNSPNFMLPAHLEDKVVQVQVGEKWVKVVDIKFLEVGTTN
jgi:hypothetical protein